MHACMHCPAGKPTAMAAQKQPEPHSAAILSSPSTHRCSMAMWKWVTVCAGP